MSTLVIGIGQKRSRPIYRDLSLQILVAMLLGALDAELQRGLPAA